MKNSKTDPSPITVTVVCIVCALGIGSMIAFADGPDPCPRDGLPFNSLANWKC